MTNAKEIQDIDFTVDKNNLYREEAIVDLKSASIRRLTPIQPDGSDDSSRTPIFIGSSQLMSPEGPLPIQARLQATTLEKAYEEFPGAMREALAQMIKELQALYREQERSKRDSSRIIMPGQL